MPCATKFNLLNTKDEQYENGYPLGYTKDSQYFLNNHLKFILKYHEEKNTNLLRVVGFEIETYSIHSSQLKVNADDTCEFTSIDDDMPKKGQKEADVVSFVSIKSPQKMLTGGNKFHMTYEVVWQPSDIPWASRWDSYLKMNDVKIHWFSIINSLVVVFFLAGILSMILLRSLRRDIAKYNREDEPEEAIEETGWKLVHGDVFRPPKNTDFFVVLIGTGIQLLSMSFIIVG